MGFWKRILINTVLFIAIAGFFQSSFHVANVWIALLASFVLAILNAAVKPVLVLLSLPITLITLGLFSIVINGFMLQMTSYVVGKANFGFSSFGMAVLVSILMSLANVIVSNFFANSGVNGD
ncbi:phage holin family protein [Lactiplantibacillus garii]|uniref:Phage holin family protein n=1 Tax=Lactiplantibacillus garii TaxID=2306423 RepID=A0A3R8JA59_9LACO|nr:phage holin family protein [Lactiplantibacillus garii]RRK11787.1 phage holin family protein [Lactiplantibacillus garii]